MRVIMLAPPGAGKGTQSERIAARYRVPHISSGDLFREEIAAGTPVGKRVRGYLHAGDLVPDDLVLGLVMDRLAAAEDNSGGYVLDGFPRTLAQAEAAAAMAQQTHTAVQAVIYLDAPEDVLLARITGRGEDRADDSEAVARHRFEVYEENTEPLIDYFTSRGLIVKVDAAPPIEVVSQEIFQALDRIAAADPA